MELSGKIIQVLEARSGVSQKSGNNWMVQEYVLEYNTGNSQYPRRLFFSIFGEDKINQFNIQAGQEYRVSFDIDAREFNGRYYTDIRAWNVVPAQAGATPVVAPVAAPEAPVGPAPEPADPVSDLPF